MTWPWEILLRRGRTTPRSNRQAQPPAHMGAPQGSVQCLAQKPPHSRTPSAVVKASSSSSKPTTPHWTSMAIQERNNHGATKIWIPHHRRRGPGMTSKCSRHTSLILDRRWWNFVTFYLGLSIGNWTLGSTTVGIGLNWWESLLVIFASQLISSVAVFFNSRCASVSHIGHPVVARSVFDM